MVPYFECINQDNVRPEDQQSLNGIIPDARFDGRACCLTLENYEAALKVYPALFEAHNHIGLILGDRHFVGDVLAGP